MELTKSTSNIRAERCRVGMSQRQLAEILDVTPASISRWECGECNPSMANLKRMAGLFGTTLDYLIADTSQTLVTR